MPEDLHVESLTYSLRTEGGVSFSEAAPPVSLIRPAFEATLAEGTLTATMREHFADEASARESVEPDLRAWEVVATLEIGRPEFSFRFAASHIVNRAAAEGTHDIRLASTVEIAGSMTSHVTRGKYPLPPSRPVKVTADMEMLLARWEQYVRGRDSLLGMAYFCLTAIEVILGRGDRAAAATGLGVSRRVLTTLGRLTGGGDAAAARKFAPSSRALTDAETSWVQAAIPKLILRIGEVEAARGPEGLPELTLADLPALTN